MQPSLLITNRSLAVPGNSTVPVRVWVPASPSVSGTAATPAGVASVEMAGDAAGVAMDGVATGWTGVATGVEPLPTGVAAAGEATGVDGTVAAGIVGSAMVATTSVIGSEVAVGSSSPL